MNKMIDQVAEEKIPAKFDLYKSNRKYQGFEIARYPRTVLAEMTVPTEWIADYEISGGKYDSAGCWGFAPETIQSLYDKGLCPKSLGLISKLWGRVDYVNAADFCKLHAEYGFSTEKQYHALCIGRGRFQAMTTKGIEWTKSYWSALKIKDFPQWLAARQTLFIENQFRWVSLDNRLSEVGENLILYVPEYEDDKSYQKAYDLKFEIAKCSPVFIKAFRDAIKFQDRKNHKNMVIEKLNGSKAQSFHSEKAFTFSLKTQKPIAGIYAQGSNSITTSEGRFYRFSDKIIATNILWGGGSNAFIATELRHRKVGSISVAKFGKTCFAWESEFKEHIEAPTIKEAIEKFAKIQKKRGGTLCLNDVRNDKTGTAGYCLSGTKEFARNRMPFLYRLIAPFESWDLIPTEIMETEFTPISSVFLGYSNPVA
jgi:hypothetical protein